MLRGKANIKSVASHTTLLASVVSTKDISIWAFWLTSVWVMTEAITTVLFCPIL
jgi:hypothetical protein